MTAGWFALVEELARFGGAAVVNTAFGYGCYALLVWLGLNIYVAQILSQFLGALFNSRTYGIAFRSRTALHRFLVVYAVSYVVGAALLTLFSWLVGSPYLAGLLTMAGAALFNFFVLRRFVFNRRETATAEPV